VCVLTGPPAVLLQAFTRRHTTRFDAVCCLRQAITRSSHSLKTAYLILPALACAQREATTPQSQQAAKVARDHPPRLSAAELFPGMAEDTGLPVALEEPAAWALMADHGLAHPWQAFLNESKAADARKLGVCVVSAGDVRVLTPAPLCRPARAAAARDGPAHGGAGCGGQSVHRGGGSLGRTSQHCQARCSDVRSLAVWLTRAAQLVVAVGAGCRPAHPLRRARLTNLHRHHAVTFALPAARAAGVSAVALDRVHAVRDKRALPQVELLKSVLVTSKSLAHLDLR
jgi:hypothetical protein